MCTKLKKVGIVCEGPTEVNFIKHLSNTYFYPSFCIQLFPSNLEGRVSIERVVKEAKNLKNYRVVSTFVDYYGLKKQCNRAPKEIEDEIKSKVGSESFIPYLQVHETEALWFSDIEILASILHATPKQKAVFQKAFDDARGAPEEINNSYETAPSKRLEGTVPYKKTTHGTQLAKAIPLDAIKDKCPRFKAWLDAIVAEVNKVYGNGEDIKAPF